MAEPATKRDVLQPTDAEAIRLARTLLRSARYGALATIDPATGSPLATRVATATDIDGAPIILVSALSAHTRALEAEPRCSLLIGEPGKGDPLAHPRISITCRARRIQRGTADHQRISRRYLNRQPKAALYADFADFSYFRLQPGAASLNGGFARAYALEAADLLSDAAVSDGLAASEQSAIDHMNSEHADAIALYARHFAKAGDGEWQITGIDPDGLDLAFGGEVARVFFANPLPAAGDLRSVLVSIARQAREAGAPGPI